MFSTKQVIAIATLAAVLSCGILVLAQNAAAGNDERKLTEKEVPPAALATLKKLAGAATITEFEEETEFGHKCYEAVWKGPGGEIEAEVTADGELIELEEDITADQVPAAVKAAAEKEAGKDAKITYTRVTIHGYEVEFKKDGKGKEMTLTPGGGKMGEEDEDDADDDKDD